MRNRSNDRSIGGLGSNVYSRRHALQLGAVGGAVLLSPWSGLTGVAGAESPSIERFKDPLPKPRNYLPRPNGRYVVGMRQFKHEMHSDIGKVTTVWGYGDADGFSYPGPTFDLPTGQRTTVRWRNLLSRNANASHYLEQAPEVWNTIHGAEDNRKSVVHVHGAHIAAAVDGYPEATFLPGDNRLYHYDLDQQATTLWYHDHSLGNTRLNVMMGLAGMFLIRDANEQAMIAARHLPGTDHEMPLVFQDRRIKENGSLGYDRDFDDMFFGDVSLVNGKAWPHMEVEPRKYRFRMLNGANSRIYTIVLGDGSLVMHQIGSDGGFLDAPIPLTSLTLSPGERADVVIDFAQAGLSPGDDLVLRNIRPSRHDEEDDEFPIDDLLQFRVTTGGPDDVTLPATLNAVVRLREEDAVQNRDFSLEDHYDPRVGDSEWQINDLGWNDITEYVQDDTVEVWNWVNLSDHPHPMHIHLVQSQVLSRSKNGLDIPLAANEMGWKDTILVGPSETVRVISRFKGQRPALGEELYSYHCHIVEHEDHEMMRQFKLVY